MTELFYFTDWIKKIRIWKIKNYMTLGPSDNLPKIKIKPRSTYLKTLNSEVRLQNGKVLDTHFAQTHFA